MGLTRKHKRPQTRGKTHKISSGLQKFSKHKPGDDFYLFINENWLKKTKIPPTKVVYGVSEEIEQKIEDETKDILLTCEKKVGTKSLEGMLGTLSLSVKSADSQSKSFSLLNTILDGIQSIVCKEEIAVVLGELNKYKVRTLLNLYGQYENKNKTEYTYTLGVASLGLPDPSFYERRSLGRAKALFRYKQMLKKLAKLFQIPQLPSIVNLEKKLAKVLLQAEKDMIESKRTGSEIQKEFKDVPFGIFFETVGLRDWKDMIFFVDSLRWLHTLNKMFHHLGLQSWKLILSLEIILYSLSWLPPKFSQISFNFYRKELKGQIKKMSRQDQAVYAVQQYATPFFSRIYKQEKIDVTIKPRIEEMVKDILHFTKERLEQVDWLEAATRKKAQDKVEAMRFIVGYPDHFEDHKLPALETDNVLYNVMTLGKWQTEYEIKKLGQPISKRKEWDDAIFVVNAYYYEQANEMVIPSGVLLSPFYDKEKSIAWNYGGIGCVLCHEITHAFDEEGKEYDPKGFQKKWWTSKDNREYNEKTKELVKLYDKQRVFGLPVSGRKTLSENIADIGGMGIALDALKHKVDNMRLTEEERKALYREFFISYAVSWRMKEKKKKRIEALITDKHSPPFLRVNLVVSQFQEWYDAFDVQPGDNLYISPEKRIRIF